MVGDWVAPHGKGKIADFVVEGRKDDPDDPSRKPDGVVTLRFSNPHDGIRRMPDEIGGSLCVGPIEAPEDGYEAFREFRNIKYKPDGGRSVDFSEQVCVFRIRTKLDAEGNVASAYYGKIHGILLGRLNAVSPQFEMTYYLNGKPNERNLEWDRKNNLFKDLPEEDWPRRP
jgi:hypothetical protein